MPKINPMMLQVPPTPTPETRTFTDPRHPGQEFTVTFRASSGLLHDMMTDELAREYTREYVERMSDGVNIGDFNIVKVSASFCSIVADLVRAEVGEPKDVYSFGEWLRFALCAPDAFAQMTLFRDELQQKEQERFQAKPPVPALGTQEIVENEWAGQPPVFPTPAGGG